MKKVVWELSLILKKAHEKEHSNISQLTAAQEFGDLVTFMTDRIKDFPGKRNMDLRKDSLRAMRTLDVNNSAVISSLTEKWENKKLKTNCEIRLQEVAAKNDLIKEIMENLSSVVPIGVDDFGSNIGLTRTSPVGHQIEIGNQLSDVNI
ncbi:hypothetical protein Bca4012_092641 [Brassica carinata]